MYSGTGLGGKELHIGLKFSRGINGLSPFSEQCRLGQWMAVSASPTNYTCGLEVAFCLIQLDIEAMK